MIITKIEVKGRDKEDATVELKKGLNVIVGASSTGKSYVVECIQFILGSSSVPKPIKESLGYSSVEVTFKKNDGNTFILARELKKGADLTCIEVDEGGVKSILKPSHQGKKNLSEYFLGLIGMNGRILASGLKNLNHASLTLRVLEKTFLVDEKRIISSDSPMGTGQYNGPTQELSLLRSVITGQDDSEILNLKSRRKSKVALKNDIEQLEGFLERFLPDDNEINAKDLDSVLSDLEYSYEEVEKELSNLIASNSGYIVSRNEAVKRVTESNKTRSNNDALLFRFRQLEEKYLSDRERLVANSESASYLDKQEELNCPICGSGFKEEDEIDIQRIISSNSAEIEKIDLRIGDLKKVVNEISLENSSLSKKIETLENQIVEIDSVLDAEVTEKLKLNNQILKKLGVEKANYRSLREKKSQRDNVISEIGGLQVEHDAIVDEYEIPEFDGELLKFTSDISDILTRWDFPGAKKVSFDNETRDIIIGDTPRGHFGKGMRAICFSAFLLGLLERAESTGEHPGIVVLDSPLTSYKEGDVIEDGDEAVEDLIYAFYRDLCDNYKDSQVIVLDNREPEESLRDKMKYIHFSRNSKIGRYGFFPI